MTNQHRVFLGVSGASGAIYALRTLNMLLQANVAVDLCYSPSASRVLSEECEITLAHDPSVLLASDTASQLAPDQLRFFEHSDIGATPASGSGLGESVIVAPCSLQTLASISSGLASNLIERAAQVALKEGRRLIMVPRETPLSRTHIDHMSRLAWAGATLLPASPGFYHKPETVQDLVDHLCAKILGVCGISQDVVPNWEGVKPS